MVPYHRAISAWVALKKQKEIPGFLNKLKLPVPEPADLKKLDKDEVTKRFISWYKSQTLDADIDIAYYQILQVLPKRKLINTLLLLGKTADEIQFRLNQQHKLLYPVQAIYLYADLFWDTSIEFNQLLNTVSKFGDEEKAVYLTALLGNSWEAELGAGLVPDISLANFLKFTIASGMKAVQNVLNQKVLKSPDKMIALALRAAELLKEIEKVSDRDPMEDLSFGLTLLEKDNDSPVSDYQGKILQTNKAEDV